MLVSSSASPHKFTVVLSSHHRHWKKQPTHVSYYVSEVKCTFARAYSRELMKKPKSIKHFPSADKIKAKLLGVNIYKSLVVSPTQFLLSFRFWWSATEVKAKGARFVVVPRNRKVSFSSSLSVYVKMNSNVIIFIISTLALFPLLIECYAEKCPTSKRAGKKVVQWRPPGYLGFEN